jgi:predicted component of type VI protein secretion system
LDIDGLRHCLECLSDPAVSLAMRPAARQAVAHLGLAEMSERLLGLYRSLL